eukprot:TRINITY_DN15952_c0_g1_i2.p1 TRINITY_DN15952_c0_g1~~TRINITY_DN15952_c0_g1_i2.p1  ORF type:complete len:121 (-),score=19.98 TRINITY_DN15952_c0_g1_i2:10-372(-)
MCIRDRIKNMLTVADSYSLYFKKVLRILGECVSSPEALSKAQHDVMYMSYRFMSLECRRLFLDYRVGATIAPELGYLYHFSQEFLETTSLKPSLGMFKYCLLYTSPSPRDRQKSRMPSSA